MSDIQQLYLKVGQNTQQLNMLMAAVSEHAKKAEARDEKMRSDLSAHISDEMSSFDEHKAELRAIREFIERMIPEDHDRDHRYVANLIKRQELHNDLVQKVTAGVSIGAILALISSIGAVLWFALTEFVKHGGGK